ncbi:hypothetical protein B1759_17700 [Rubrivirga sp. SAORIC476]|nr:hypothetical protein B1759_17700 [Rubrivirga sp. SAORIC476]
MGSVGVHRSARGTYFSGLQTCGHSTCPVCGPTIREAERVRLRALVEAHLEAGGSLYVGVLTLSHGPRDRVEDLMDALDSGRSAAIGGTGGSRWAKDRRDFGVQGVAWHREEVHGRNGWHVHVHLVLFTSGPLTSEALEALQKRLYGRHRDALEARGFRSLEAFNGLQEVRAPEALPGYLTKADGAADRVAAESTRGDVKTGKGLTPGRLLQRFVETGDMDDLNRWRDLEAAAAGRRWRHLPAALVKRYGVGTEEPDLEAGTEEEENLEAAEERDRADAKTVTGGVEVFRIPLTTWRTLTRTLGAVGKLRHLVHVGDLEAARALVESAARETARRHRDRGPAWARHVPPEPVGVDRLGAQ